MDTFRKKALIVIVFWFLVLMAGAGIYFYYNQDLFGKFQNWLKKNFSRQENGAGISLPSLSNLIPSGFPSDIPIENEARLEQSYSKDYQEAGKQLTVVFASKKSVAENQNIYTDYLINNQWAIHSNSADEKLVSFYAQKDDMDLNLVIFSDEQSGNVKISISVLMKK